MSASTKVCAQCGREYDASQKFCPEDGSTLRSTKGSGDLVGEIVADRYHILGKLGEGGMGQVYLAEHVRMKRKSAVKVMTQGMMNDPDAISRFNREAANASQINHPNVAAIYDFGETSDGLIYLAMEYVEGESLSRLVERHHALPAPRAAEITRQAAEALAVAHSLGIVHRDLKPDNIMIARDLDGSDLVKVVDFGIAKATRGGGDGQKVTRTGYVVGTPEYMSPEQLAGDTVDGRSDIYSLALVAFNMFTGSLPFPSRTSQEAMIMRLTDRPRTLAEMKADVPWPPALQAVMDRALARDAAERYQDARAFGRDLVKALEGMPALTAEQLGTQMVTAHSLAAHLPSSKANIDAAKGLPTMAAPVPVGLGGTAGVASGVRPGATVSALAQPGHLNVPTAAAPVLVPARGGNRGALLAGAGIAVVALAGAAYVFSGRDDAPHAAQTAAPQAQAAAPAAGTEAPVVASADPAPSAAAVSAPGAGTASRPEHAPPSAPAARAPVRTPPTRTERASAASPPRVASGTPAGAAPASTAPASTAPASTAPSTPASQPASQPAAPAPQPVVTAAAPAPAAPAFDAEAATREIRTALDRFAAAFETRRIDEVRRVAPGISTEFARRWETLLAEKSVTDLRASVSRVGPPEFDGGTADVFFAMKLAYRIGGQTQTPEIQYSARLRRDGGTWRITSVSGR